MRKGWWYKLNIMVKDLGTDPFLFLCGNVFVTQNLDRAVRGMKSVVQILEHMSEICLGYCEIIKFSSKWKTKTKES